jgi:hypothetical protein
MNIARQSSALANASANKILIPVLESGAGRRLGRRLALVDYDGRRTGEHHQLVTMYTVDGKTARITVGKPEWKTWWRNFSEPHPLRLRLAGHDHDTAAQVVREEDRVFVIAQLDIEPSRAPRPRRP